MRWPWTTERRADSATQIAIRAIEAGAADTALRPETVSACKTAATLYATAFAGCQIEGVHVESDWLPTAIRETILNAESLHVLQLRRGTFSLLPAASWDVTGGPDSSAWTYSADLVGPSASNVRTVGRDGVCWLPWELSAVEPWRGRGPWQGSVALRALQALESSCEAEGLVPGSRIASVPKSMTEAVREAITSVLRRARGRTVLLDDLREYGGGQQPSGGSLRFERLGFDAPNSLGELRRSLEESVLAAAGVPSELAYPAAGGATASREAFRRFYHASLLPMKRRIENELTRLFETEIKISLRDLGAADIQARARAVNSLTSAGMELAEAKEIAGVG